MFLLMLLLPAFGPGAARADDPAGDPAKSVRLGFVVPRRTASELGRLSCRERRELLGAIQAALESRFAAVVPLAGVGRIPAAKIDVVAILRVRLGGRGPADSGRVDVELAFWTPRASLLTVVKAVGEGPRAGEDAAARIAGTFTADVPALLALDALWQVVSTPL